MERIIGILFSGFTVRAFGVCLALYVGVEVAGFVSDTFGAGSAVLETLKAGR